MISPLRSRVEPTPVGGAVTTIAEQEPVAVARPRGGRAPVNVLYLLDALDGVHGGTEKQLLQLIGALDPARFVPHIWVLRGPVAVDCTPFAGRARVLGIGKLLSPGALWRLASMSRTIRRLDIRLVHILLNDAAIVGPLFAKLAGTKVVASRRDLGFWYRRRTLAALRVSNHFVDRIVANSEQVSRSVRRHEWTRRQQVVLIHNGHDPRRFDAPPLPGFRQAHGIGPHDPVVGVTANLKPLKRHADLFRAFALVREWHPTAHLVLAGAGEEEAALRSLAHSLGLDGAVHFLGFVSDPVPVIKHFDVGVLCSETEGLSNAVIEYMACGKPVVCTKVGGNVELIRDGVDGFLVDVGDIEALADRVARLLGDPDLASRLGRQASRNPLATRTDRDMATAYMQLYDDLLGA